MKKFKNLVIGGIENKVINLVLITVILLAIAFQAANYVQMSRAKLMLMSSSAREATPNGAWRII